MDSDSRIALYLLDFSFGVKSSDNTEAQEQLLHYLTVHHLSRGLS